jgi:hypothetical protein
LILFCKLEHPPPAPPGPATSFFRKLPRKVLRSSHYHCLGRFEILDALADRQIEGVLNQIGLCWLRFDSHRLSSNRRTPRLCDSGTPYATLFQRQLGQLTIATSVPWADVDGVGQGASCWHGLRMVSPDLRGTIFGACLRNDLLRHAPDLDADLCAHRFRSDRARDHLLGPRIQGGSPLLQISSYTATGIADWAYPASIILRRLPGSKSSESNGSGSLGWNSRVYTFRYSGGAATGRS